MPEEISGASPFLANFEVDNLAKVTELVLANRGTVLLVDEEKRLAKAEGLSAQDIIEQGLDIVELPERMGRQRFFCDPAGNMFGAFEPPLG